MELLDVPGDGGLGGVDAPLPQVFQKLLLGLDLGGGDDVQDLLLSFAFHCPVLPSF